MLRLRKHYTDFVSQDFWYFSGKISHGDVSHGDGEFDTFFLFVQWEKRIRFAKKINRYGKKGENS